MAGFTLRNRLANGEKIFAAWISYMSPWLAFCTKAPVSCEPSVVAETWPTAAPAASWAAFTGCDSPRPDK